MVLDRIDPMNTGDSTTANTDDLLLSTIPASYKIYPSKDTYIRSGGDSDENFGTDDQLKTKADRHALVEFDLAAEGIPATAVITSATGQFLRG